ncbi:hypothetical protein PVAP13_6KG116300 [Panicum virgatum]|uniref:Uncharacterized protein n=1 Tax=Panicum virgatum TaxID=38727 RepID=A0A8T0RAV6_PANVG|nr:hypothetical protein PVAP13_6KG116300 [Panicum virgatum]
MTGGRDSDELTLMPIHHFLVRCSTSCRCEPMRQGHGVRTRGRKGGLYV